MRSHVHTLRHTYTNMHAHKAATHASKNMHMQTRTRTSQRTQTCLCTNLYATNKSVITPTTRAHVFQHTDYVRTMHTPHLYVRNKRVIKQHAHTHFNTQETYDARVAALPEVKDILPFVLPHVLIHYNIWQKKKKEGNNGKR